MKKIRVMLADDHPVFRSGLKHIINLNEEFEVVEEVGDGNQVLEKLSVFKPDILILDISLPGKDGITLSNMLISSRDPVKILILTMHDDIEHLQNLIGSGVKGYLTKNAADTELITALKMVASGSRYIDSSLAFEAISSMNASKNTSCVNEKSEGVYKGEGSEKEKEGDEASPLTLRETEILKLVALGYTNAQISHELFLSIKTVESHKAHIKNKLNIDKRSELVRYAIANNYL